MKNLIPTDLLEEDEIDDDENKIFDEKDAPYTENIIIENGITKICKYAFHSWTYLQNITIPSSVTEIGEYAFRDCKNLKKITIPNS